MAVFMIGSDCSGSDRLQSLLNRLPDVAAPPPVPILQRMTPLLDRYGDLAEQRNYLALIEDVCQMVRLNPAPWEHVPLSRDDIAERTRSRTLVNILAAVYDQAMFAKRAREWSCGSVENINHLPQIESYVDNAKYISIYRDGRDVAVSLRAAASGDKHFFHIARAWAQDQRLAMTMAGIIGPERCFRVKYEQLVAQPALVMDQLCEFLGSSYRSEAVGLLAPSHRAAAGVAHLGLANADKISKYLSEAREEDIRIFESVAGKVLDGLGYPRSAVPIGKELYFRESQIKLFDAENEVLKRETQAKADEVEQRRQTSQKAFLADIARRDTRTDDVLGNLDRAV